MYASVGKVAILKDNVATSQAFYNLVFDNNILRDFIFHVLRKMEINSEWEKVISTGTQRNLNAQKVKELMINIPISELEKEKIGNLFTSLDHLITLHQRKPYSFQQSPDNDLITKSTSLFSSSLIICK